MRYYQCGDVVKVWSLQSFSGGGFLDGETAIVRQTQTGKSVLLIVSRKPPYDLVNDIYKYSYVLDTCYEVYSQQIALVRKARKGDNLNVTKFLQANALIREYEAHKFKQKDIKKQLSSNYAPEFFIDDYFEICLNKDMCNYPELCLQYPNLFF